MTTQAIVSREAWLEARRDLLAAEKDLTHRGDRVAELRRKLPWVRVETPYVFEGPNGEITLADLFTGRSQLLVQHFMLGPGWKEGCKSCSYMADHADGMIPHLAQRDVIFVAISRAPYAEIARFHQRMGWHFNWVSSHANDFNRDFRVSFTPDEIAAGKIDYNFRSSPHRNDELPGVSAFVRNETGEIFHTYSTYGRGVEVMMGTYRMLDLTPRGRAEDGLFHTMQWVRHHDCYKHHTPPQTSSCCSEQQ
jgi:predicted dithiol-disulfide oxidoreductase (DUF899 family)